MAHILYIAVEVESAPGAALTLVISDGAPIKLAVDETRGRMLRQLGLNLNASLTAIGPGRVLGASPIKVRQPSLF